jgi:hypothetical protein
VNVNDSSRNIVGDAANEPSIAVDPTDPDIMVIGWRQFDTISSNFRQAGCGYTTDGGQTWTFPGVIEPGIFRSDPVLDSDRSGGIYYYSLSTATGFTCEMFKSTDGGVSWSGAVPAYGGDKAWMTIDRAGGLGDGNIYCFSRDGVSTTIVLTRSVDGGQSFQPLVNVPRNPGRGTIAVGVSGELYAAGRSFDNGEFVLARSINAYDRHSTPVFEFSSQLDLGGQYSAYAGPNPGGLLGQTGVACNHSLRRGRGDVYVLSSVDPPGLDPLDVHFIRSTDLGQTWSLPVRINDDAVESAWQWFGTMSIAPTGRIDVIWLDTRDDPGGLNSSLYYSYSMDRGVTWSPNERLSDSFDPHLGWPQQNKMGDYFDMTSDEIGAHLAWAGTFNGEQDVYYGRILTLVGIEEPEIALNFSLSQNFPNPFNPSTTIRYRLPQEVFVTLKVHNMLGEQLATLVNEEKETGSYQVQFDGTGLASGVYIYRLQAGVFVDTKKLLLLK